MSSSLTFALRALRYRNYRLFFGGQVVSLIGTWITTTATNWLVYRLTGSAILLGAVGFAGQFPAFLLGPFAGIVVDRYDRHRLLVLTQTISMVQSFALAALVFSGRITIAWIVVLSIVQGLVNAFDMPGRQAFLLTMIDDKADLGNAIALNSSMVNVARLVGPSIAGVVIAATNEGWCFLIDGFSYLAVILALLLMRDVRRGFQRARTSAITQFKEGLRYVTHHRLLFPQALATGSSNFATNVVFAVYFVYAYRHLGLTPALMGIIGAIGATGWLIGSVSADWLRRRLGVNGATILGMAVGAPAALLIPFAPQGHAAIPFLALAGMLGGFGAVVYNIQQVSLRQAITPERLQGRMNASMRFFVWGTIPLGSLVSGVLATWIGLRPTLFVGTIGCTLAILPVALSSVRQVKELPTEPEDLPVTEEALLPTQVATLSSEGPGA